MFPSIDMDTAYHHLRMDKVEVVCWKRESSTTVRTFLSSDDTLIQDLPAIQVIDLKEEIVFYIFWLHGRIYVDTNDLFQIPMLAM
jgi:hypothetical protein